MFQNSLCLHLQCQAVQNEWSVCHRYYMVLSLNWYMKLMIVTMFEETEENNPIGFTYKYLQKGLFLEQKQLTTLTSFSRNINQELYIPWHSPSFALSCSPQRNNMCRNWRAGIVPFLAGSAALKASTTSWGKSSARLWICIISKKSAKDILPPAESAIRAFHYTTALQRTMVVRKCVTPNNIWGEWSHTSSTSVHPFLWKSKTFDCLVKYGTMSCPSGKFTHLGILKNANRPNSIKKINTTPKCGFQ